MPKFIMLRGIPASGKTTYAMALVEQGYKRVNKDEIREELFGKMYKPSDEPTVNLDALKRMEEYLVQGYNVISDNTNLHGRFVDAQLEMVKRLGALLVVKNIEVDTEEAIYRDLKREKHVGEKTIRTLAKVKQMKPLRDTSEAGGGPEEPLKWDCFNTRAKNALDLLGERTKAIIVDIDGTIANTDKRSDVAKSKATYLSHKWWDAFFDPALADLDTPIGESATVLRMLQSNGPHKIVYLTGRRDNMEKATLTWLKTHNFPDGELIIRHKGTKTLEFKKSMMDHLTTDYDITMAFDNNDENIALFESYNIPQVYKIETNSAEAWAGLLAACKKGEAMARKIAFSVLGDKAKDYLP